MELEFTVAVHKDQLLWLDFGERMAAIIDPDDVVVCDTAGNQLGRGYSATDTMMSFAIALPGNAARVYVVGAGTPEDG